MHQGGMEGLEARTGCSLLAEEGGGSGTVLPSLHGLVHCKLFFTPGAIEFQASFKMFNLGLD